MGSNSVPHRGERPKTMRQASDLANDYINVLDARASGERHYIDSGFKSLDRDVPAWLHEGHLIVIAGRPAMGKTAFAQQIAEFVAEKSLTSIFFTLEMSGYEITERSISRRSGVQIPDLKTVQSIDDERWSRITRALHDFGRLHLLVDDASFDAESLVKKAKAAAGRLSDSQLPALGCIVVDYIQLVEAHAANRALEIGQVTRALKRLARELKVPVLALSQLNRGVENRVNKRPNMSDLRESGNIEQDADLIMFLYRDDYYNAESEHAGTVEVIVAKNRHGSSGMTRLAFIADRVMFGDLTYSEVEPQRLTPTTKAKECRRGEA